MKNILKDAGILFAITLIAGLLLGVVYEVTKEPIALQEEKARAEAFQQVFANAASFQEVEDFDSAEAENIVLLAGYPEETIDSVVQALDESGDLLGYVLNVTTHAGYGGDITFSMGIQLGGVLNGISILSIAETAGLGMRAEEVLQPQFSNKEVESFVYTKTGAVNQNEIDAISSATITTSAITNGVNAGLAYFDYSLKGGAVNE